MYAILRSLKRHPLQKRILIQMVESGSPQKGTVASVAGFFFV
jgi:hypothetical protein